MRWLRDRYLFLLDSVDRLRGRSGDLIAPRSLHFVGAGGADFHATGRAFHRYFTELGGLRPDHSVLDIGCGTGRMAIPLLDYLDGRGAYAGFDISTRAIRWCQQHITTRNPRFRFVFADVKNAEYNPQGALEASSYQFPFEDSSVDFAFATSVFTHMREGEVARYLAELSRCLKPTGRALLTFFVLDAVAGSLMGNGQSAAQFTKTPDGVFTIDTRAPERAIAYPEETLRRLFSEACLRIEEPIRWGSWSGRANALDYQDLVVAVKA